MASGSDMDSITNGVSQYEQDGEQVFTEEYARLLDAKDHLRHLREEFIIPSKDDLKRKTLSKSNGTSTSQDQANGKSSSPSCIYLCGNSLGLQPRRTSTLIQQHLETWATKGVYGHFKKMEDSSLPPWVNIDDAAKNQMAKIVGARPSEVAVMETLTANLHLLMASFYRPTKERWKIIIEGKAFPSDHYAAESQIRHHNLDPSSALVLIEPPSPDAATIPTSHILSIIDQHASTTALILLPGVQFYTGQYLDIPTITAHAHSRGISIGWDLAHAVGNLPLQLHDWDVDFAAWCNYKYMNCGPGAIGGLFVHERQSQISDRSSSSANGDTTTPTAPTYRPRLSGWWGSSKETRFAMKNQFIPIPGAAGFQLSNPSALDLTAVLGSLHVFDKTSMHELRAKSLRLTGYLEYLLTHAKKAGNLGTASEDTMPYTIVTPSDASQRGAQLSVRLEPGLLDVVMQILEDEGVVVDERKPDVVRVAPAPLYNTFQDVWHFVKIFRGACRRAVEERQKKGDENGSSLMVEGGKREKGWSDIK